MESEKYISIAQLAKILGISRIAVYKRVKKGQIEAIRIGKAYAISASNISGKNLTQKSKNNIAEAVKKTVDEYGEALKMLGDE